MTVRFGDTARSSTRAATRAEQSCAQTHDLRLPGRGEHEAEVTISDDGPGPPLAPGSRFEARAVVKGAQARARSLLKRGSREIEPMGAKLRAAVFLGTSGMPQP